jgi:predicted RND superfamily exporter protein
VLTALCAVGATRPRLSIREQDQLPQSHPDVQVYNRINEGFGGGAAVIVGVLPHGGDAFTPATLASVARIIGADFVLPGPSPDST